ncbi:MAG: hypothetical protein KF858_17165 [Candidatus Sumerlaeia bacterium]|nr:hypothetical protein [Candidatus Sumerlaeia bacterium]
MPTAIRAVARWVLREASVLAMMLPVPSLLVASACPSAPPRGFDGLECYDFGQETSIYSRDGAVVNEYAVSGRVYVDRESTLVLKEYYGEGAGAETRGSGTLWAADAVCVTAGHSVLSCYDGDSAPDEVDFREPFLVRELLGGRCNGLEFANILAALRGTAIRTHDGWDSTEYRTDSGARVLLVSCRQADALERRIEAYHESGSLVYSIQLTGGSPNLPEHVEIVRYHIGTTQARFRHRIGFTERGAGNCTLITGALGEQELLARVYRPEEALTITRTNRTGESSSLINVRGQWFSEADLRAQAERESPREMPRSEQIRANRPGFGADSRLTGGFLMGGGVGVLLLSVLLWWRSRRT